MSDAARAIHPPQEHADRAAERLIVALDFPTVDEANGAVDALGDTVSFYKIGLRLQFDAKLSQLFERLRTAKKNIFLDYKYMDIPDTIEAVVRAASAFDMKFITVIGQPHIVEAAIRGREGSELKILAVTLLTGMNEMDMRRAYSTTLTLNEFIRRRAKDVINIGCDGLISSPNELAVIRNALPNKEFLIVTPGIRPAGTSKNDQKRVATPFDAIKNGADYLVVGRPITTNHNPEAAARRILDEMAWGFEARENRSFTQERITPRNRLWSLLDFGRLRRLARV